jgi:nucleoside 2-deoxyribosyltransferase
LIRRRIYLNVYIACPWKHKETAKQVKSQCLAAGLSVTSRWIDFELDPNFVYDYPTQVMHDEAMKDLEDVANSDAMLYMNLAKSEGKATEMGFAIANDIPVFVVGGKDNNVFLHSDYVHHYDTVEAVIAELVAFGA